MTYYVLGKKNSHNMINRHSLVMILSNIKKTIFHIQAKQSRHQWGNKITMQADLLKKCIPQRMWNNAPKLHSKNMT